MNRLPSRCWAGLSLCDVADAKTRHTAPPTDRRKHVPPGECSSNGQPPVPEKNMRVLFCSQFLEQAVKISLTVPKLPPRDRRRSTSQMSLDIEIKLAIYQHFAQTGQRPSPALIAEHVRAKVSEVREAYAQLCAERVLVLEADGESIRMAPPFSGVPTQHLVVIDGISYFANCAWDAFGLPAALHRAACRRRRG